MIDTKFVLLIEDAFPVLYWPEQSSQFFMIAEPNYVNKLIYPLHNFFLADTISWMRNKTDLSLVRVV